MHKLKSALNEVASTNDQTRKCNIAKDVDRMARMANEIREVITRFG